MTRDPRPRRSTARASSSDRDRTQPVAAVAAGGTRRARRVEGDDKKRRRRRIVGRVLLALVVLGVVGTAGLGYVLAQVPLPEAVPPVETTFIYDAAGNRLAQLSAGENRVSKELGEISPNLVNAVLAAEDRDFFTHNGIDAKAIVRATVADLRGKPLQGGSTITQQYVKVVYTNRERSLMRKLKEATLAVKLERRFEKEEILERYLNVIYFGRGAYGAQAASQAYFGVDVGELNEAQAAYLAGLIRAPEAADANRGDPEQAAEADRRRNLVIRAMEEEGHLSEDQVQMIAAVPVSSYVVPRDQAVSDRVTGKEFGTEYFVEYVKQQMYDRYGETRVNGGGLQIHTTLDLSMQMIGYDAVYGTLNQEGDPAGALVSIDTEGHVKAMVGGKGFDHSQVNLAVGRDGGGLPRQVGSTFKPFVLTELVRQGYTVESMIDSPATGRYVDGREYGNYDRRGHGRIPIAEATHKSSNTAYVTMGQELGIDRVIATAHDLGVVEEIPAGEATPLGTAEIPVVQMADAYLTFATRGVQVDPIVVTRVTDADGKEIDSFAAEKIRVLDEAQADVVNDVLQGVVRRGGTGTRAAIDHPLAGKTGTTSNNADAWFVGYTPGLSTAVWMGRPEGNADMGAVHGVPSVTGGTIPAQIFAKFMGAVVTDERFSGDFVKPRSLDGKPFGGPKGRPVSETTVPRRPTTTTTSEPGPSTTTSSSTSSTTSSTVPRSTSTTSSTVVTPPTVPDGPGGGGGGGRPGQGGGPGEPGPPESPVEQLG